MTEADDSLFDPLTRSTDAMEACLNCVEAGIRAAAPRRAIDREISVTETGISVCEEDFTVDRDLLIIGGGNAAGHAAKALESVLGDAIDGGTVVTDDPVSTDVISVLQGAHPVPSQRGVDSTRRLLERAEQATEDDVVLTIVAGGGSALMPAPAEEISLEDLQAVTEDLLHSGATIGEMNAVRKHLSTIKGGRLTEAAAPATVVTLVFSDVVGDDPSVVSSGPTAPDQTTYEDALEVFDRYQIDPPRSVERCLRSGARGDRPKTPPSEASCFEKTSTYVLVDGYTAVRAAEKAARETGYQTSILSSRIRGEARDAARSQVAIAEEVQATGNPVEPPVAIISGGETTVTVQGDGTGGPNQEFALSAAIEVGDSNIAVASVDTDGIDGSTDAAGAVIDSATVGNLSDAKRALQRNDAYPYLRDAGALLISGPTGTNVNDLGVIIIEE